MAASLPHRHSHESGSPGTGAVDTHFRGYDEEYFHGNDTRRGPVLAQRRELKDPGPESPPLPRPSRPLIPRGLALANVLVHGPVILHCEVNIPARVHAQPVGRGRVPAGQNVPLPVQHAHLGLAAREHCAPTGRVPESATGPHRRRITLVAVRSVERELADVEGAIFVGNDVTRRPYIAPACDVLPIRRRRPG